MVAVCYIDYLWKHPPYFLFPDAADMEANCPGNTAEAHDD